MNLYEISKEYIGACNTLLEIEDIDDEIIENTLGTIMDSFKEKAVNLAAFIKNIEAEAEAVKEAKISMMNRQSKLERKCASLKQYLKINMQAAGIKKIDSSPLFEIKILNNSSKVCILDNNLIPNEYCHIEKIADKRLIRKLLEEGESIQGATLIKDESISIR